MTSPYPLDTGIMELDKLIHSFEFENQQYVKMIEKEQQLIMSLESQVQEKMQQSVRLEEDVSRFDEDTKRLHRLYTNNRDNIENLKSTINVLSDHEVAVSKQLEITRAKTEENRKFYKTHISNYSSTNEDYMKKYMKFPLAIELENKRVDLNVAQRKLDDIEAVKQDLKERITTKEDELDYKVMSRIMVKIAKTKLTTYKLEKDIHECLAEKTDLVEKLKDIRTSKQPEQCDQIVVDHESSIDKQSMETGSITSGNIDDCEVERPSDNTEGFSNMCITEDHQKSFNDDAINCTQSDDNEPSVISTEDMHCQGAMQPEIHVDTENVWSVLAPREENLQQKFSSRDSPFEDGDLGSTPISYHHERSVNAVKQLHLKYSTVSTSQTSAQSAAMQITRPLERTRSEDPIASPFVSTVSSTTPLLSRRSAGSVTPLIRPTFSQQSGQPLVQAPNSTAATSHNKVPSMLHFPRLSVPKPPRIPPPSVSRIQPMLLEHCNTSPSYSEIKKPLVPPFNILKDFQQKLNLCLPRLPAPPLHQFSTLTKTTVLTSTITEENLDVPDEGHHDSNRTQQAPQFQTKPAGFTSRMMPSTQVHASVQPSRQLMSSSEEPVAGKQVPNIEDASRTQTHVSGHSVTAFNEQICDFEIPVPECDSPPGKADKHQTMFKVNKGSHSPSSGSKSPKGNYSKSPTHGKKSAVQGFLFESLFGNFEKNANEDSTEIELEAPTSIFSLFNVSQNPGSRNAGEDSSDAGPFFTLGKFTEEAGSPSSDNGPCNLMNLFTKSQNSETSNHEFAINVQGDGEQEDRATFKLADSGKESYFSYGRRCSSDEEEDKPLFNLF